MVTRRGWTEKRRRAGRLESLGDVPSVTHVVADAGDKGDFAGEVQRNHNRSRGANKMGK